MMLCCKIPRSEEWLAGGKVWELQTRLGALFQSVVTAVPSAEERQAPACVCSTIPATELRQTEGRQGWECVGFVMSTQRAPVLWTQMVAREGKRTFPTPNMSYRRDGRVNSCATWEVRGRGGKLNVPMPWDWANWTTEPIKDQSSVDRGRSGRKDKVLFLVW